LEDLLSNHGLQTNESMLKLRQRFINFYNNAEDRHYLGLRLLILVIMGLCTIHMINELYNALIVVALVALFLLNVDRIFKNNEASNITLPPVGLVLKTSKVLNYELSEIKYFFVNDSLKYEWRLGQINDSNKLKQEIAAVDQKDKQCVVIESHSDAITNIFILESNSYYSKTTVTCYSVIKPNHDINYLKCSINMLLYLNTLMTHKLNSDFDVYIIEEDKADDKEEKMVLENNIRARKDIAINARAKDVYEYLKDNENKIKVNRYITDINLTGNRHTYDYRFKISSEKLVFRNNITESFKEVRLID
jgi:hypothetical protein